MKKIILIIVFCMFFCLASCSKNEETPLHQFVEDKETRLLRINIADYGNIDFRIYPDSEPEVAGKLIELAESGFYDGKSFFSFIEDYVCIAGDENVNENPNAIVRMNDEPSLYPFYGALCVSVGADNKCDLSQFYVITCTTENINNMQELVEFKGYTFNDYIKFGYNTELEPDELELYQQYGGAPWLQGHTCVVGQAYEGMDILEEICKDFLNGDGTDKYKIESIETDKQS